MRHPAKREVGEGRAPAADVGPDEPPSRRHGAPGRGSHDITDGRDHVPVGADRPDNAGREPDPELLLERQGQVVETRGVGGKVVGQWHPGRELLGVDTEPSGDELPDRLFENWFHDSP